MADPTTTADLRAIIDHALCSPEEPSAEFLAGYKLGGDHNLIGVTRAVSGMALRRSVAGKPEAAQALRELESDLRAILLNRGVTDA